MDWYCVWLGILCNLKELIKFCDPVVPDVEIHIKWFMSLCKIPGCRQPGPQVAEKELLCGVILDRVSPPPFS